MPRDTRPSHEILDHVTTSRAALTSAIDGLSADQLTAVDVVGHWSVKDLLAHIGRWEDVCLTELQKHLRGEQIRGDYRDALPYNDQWEAELQALSLTETLSYFETTHAHLLSFLATLTTEQWDGYVRAWVQGAVWHHFEEHGAEIRTWRDQL